MENRIKKFFESYNKSDAIDILHELAKFVDRLPSLTVDEEKRALTMFETDEVKSLREAREMIENSRNVEESQ